MKPSPPLPAVLAGHATQRFDRCRERADAAGIELPDLAALPGDAERVWACSEFVAGSCIAAPALLAGLLTDDGLRHPRDPQPARDAVYAIARGCGDEASLMLAVRHARRREMVRIAWRDIGALAGFHETVADTSAFADAVTDACLERLHEWACAAHGEPRSASGEPLRMVVLALGKLGAGELNFSSDIDLMFACAESGETLGRRRALSSDEFFTRVGQRLIHVLSHQGEGGYVFRVDMRLRPFGNSGPLVSSFDALEHYYQAHGRDWERYALVRARPMAGDLERGEEIVERLRPFVYRRYLDFSALESLRDMKRIITEEVSRKGLHDNVKLGPGGIREIEFTGQAFQMVRGGRHPELRDRRIENVLTILGERDYLPDHAVTELRNAYRFLRDSEHRLQQWEDRQTHMLPDDDIGRARLAAGMRYPDWASYARDLARHRGRVTAQFEQVFGAADNSEADVHGSLATLWEGHLDAERAHAVLREAGIDQPDAVWQQILDLRSAVRRLDKKALQRLGRLLPALLSVVASRGDSVETLQRTFQVLEAAARRSIYLSLLVERPLVLSQLLKLCAASPMIARDLGRQPLLLDELLDARTLYAPLSRAELAEDLDQRLAGVAAGDTEQEMEVLRQFQQANVLRVAAADVSQAMPLMIVSDHLSWLAEVVVERVLSLARRDLGQRYGEARHTLEDGRRVDAPFAVIAYGKLGGLELGYGSDLDLVFVHGSSGEEQHSDGERPVDNVLFFGRLAQRMIHFITTRTSAGSLYEVDSRLRPSGSKGLLVTSIGGLEHYLREEAWTWEQQALVRARCIAGDPALRERFARVRREVLLRPRDPHALRAEVREMRARMRRELGSRDPASFDLKQDPGGIADIEFMVQYAVLRWAARLGSHLDFTDNIRLLEGFAANRMLSASDADTLADVYRVFRARIHALALQKKQPLVPATEFTSQREAVGRLWRVLMENDD